MIEKMSTEKTGQGDKNNHTDIDTVVYSRKLLSSNALQKNTFDMEKSAVNKMITVLIFLIVK